MQQAKRNISLDLYRILCMFLITTIHIVGYSNLTDVIPHNHFNSYVILVLQVFQKIAINGFILISAYFLVSAKTATKKIISFWLQLLVASVCILLISVIFVSPNLPISLLAKSLFPILTNHYWYPTNYIILLLFVPFFNKAILAMDKRQFKVCIVLLAGVATFFFHVNPFFNPEIYIGHESHSLLWFFTLYFIGAYLRLYGVSVSRWIVWCTLLLSGILLLGSIALENNALFNITGSFSFVKKVINHMHLTQNNSILALLFTVCSFVIFKNMNLPSSKALSAIFAFLAPTVFGIYLIQEHDAIRQFLWDTVHIEQWATSYGLFAIMIGIFLCIWAFSILLYLFYQLMHKLFVNKIEDCIVNYWEKIKSVVSKRMS